MSDNKKAFLSYSHVDREFAEKLARTLQENGIDVWFDAWQLQAGDSIVQKIFTHGLERCSVFLIVLSNASVQSKWVRYELDAAIVQRIAGLTHIVPVIKEKCEIPFPLRTLQWVDLGENFDEGVHSIIHSLQEISTNSPLGNVPSYNMDLSESIGELSKAASVVGTALLNLRDEARGNEASLAGPALKALIPSLTVQQVNDAVDELGEYGLVHIVKWSGTAPYEFGEVQATYALYLHFRDASVLDYDPQEDIRLVATAVASRKMSTGADIQAICGLSPLRINRAVEYLRDYGMVEVRDDGGTSSFSFGCVEDAQRQEQGQRQVGSRQLADSILSEVEGSRPCSLFGFMPPDVEKMKCLGRKLRDAAQMLSNHKREMLGEHKQECFNRIQEMRETHDAWWEMLKQHRSRHFADDQSRIRANLEQNVERRRRAITALKSCRAHADELRDRIASAWNDDWRSRAEGWLSDLEAKTRDIELALERIEEWIREDENKLR
jgi:hypothetical protein